MVHFTNIVFNKFNRNFGFIRLIQSRSNSAGCTSYNQSNCVKSKITTSIQKGIHTWNYNEVIGGNVIRGEKGDFDFSGFYEDFNLNSHATFYQSWTKLKENNWIDSDTDSIITILNFYNINHDLVITLNVLHEFVEGNFKPKATVSLFDLTPITDLNLYFSIILSLVNLFSLFTVLRKRNYVQANYRKDHGKPILKRFSEYMSNRFRQPDLFEVVSNTY